MFAKLLFLFTAVPLLELYLLIKVSEHIGGLATIVLVGATGFFGVVLAKSQGFLVLRSLQGDISQGFMPKNDIFDGLFILVGGAFLLTPGLITDFLGFCCLIPFTRKIIKQQARKWLQKKMENGDNIIIINNYKK
ncbi:FxsA family protein [Proteinivorax hydrogeniformans]|uniref:FxsA family protein n=1 Tax=Proteinivorax hydrogeniformans TaxID=1826727 RepID=A0AAU8HW14_9FIRM